MFSGLFGGAISAVTDLAGSLYNTNKQVKADRYNADLQYKASQAEIAWAREQQRIANQFNLDMWQRENEYNSPKNQMQRFKDAGLNPALMYSQGTPGNSTGAPQFSAIQPSPSAFRQGADKVAFQIPQLGNVLNHMIGTMSAAIDLQNKKKQGDLLDTQADYTRNRSFLDHVRGEFISDELSRKLRNADQQYYLRGGDFTTSEVKKIHDYTMMDRSLSPKFRQSQIELYSALRSAKLQDILTNIAREKDLKASTKLKRIQAQFHKWKNHEYETVYKPYNEALGPFRPAAEAVGGAALDTIGTLLEMYLNRGTSTITDVLEEFTTTPKGFSDRKSKRSITKSH